MGTNKIIFTDCNYWQHADTDYCEEVIWDYFVFPYYWDSSGGIGGGCSVWGCCVWSSSIWRCVIVDWNSLA